MSISFIIGSGAYFFKYRSELVDLEKYDYSLQDSLFWNNRNHSDSVLRNKKKVDYERELLDFSNNNYSNRAEKPKQKININNSTIEELILLPGIGEKTAKKIIEYRNKHGRFNKLTDLINIPGIGNKKLKKIKNLLIIE